MARQKWICNLDGTFTEFRERDRGEKVHVLQDSMEPLAHPCTGELMDSKSAFRRVTRAHGCVEYGTDAKGEPRKPSPSEERAELRKIEDAVERTWEGLKNNKIPVAQAVPFTVFARPGRRQ